MIGNRRLGTPHRGRTNDGSRSFETTVTLLLSWHRYSLSLRRPTTTGNGARRDGLLVCVRGDDAPGWGEVAPLPGLHRESVADAEIELARLAGSDDLVTAVARSALPSVRFGVETALERAVAGAAAPAGPRLVRIAALIDDSQSAVVTAGPTVAKVKVGRRPAAGERAALIALLETHPTLRVRLDGNRALDLDEACALVDGLPRERIEWLEEPLTDPDLLQALHDRTGVSIALDETMHEPHRASCWHAPAVTAWVLKPSLLGRSAVRALAADAAAARITVVISACFESGLGLWALAELAHELAPDTAAGLGTDAWLASDTIEPPFSSARGQVDLAQAVRQPRPARAP